MTTPFIWKTPLTEPVQYVNIGAVLHVGYDPKMPEAAACLWHVSDGTFERRVFVVGTGNEIPDAKFLGSSVRADGFVFHVFEEELF